MANKSKFRKWADWVKDYRYLSTLIAVAGVVVAAVLIGVVVTAVIHSFLPLIGLVVLIPTIFVIGAAIYNRFFRESQNTVKKIFDNKPFIATDNKEGLVLPSDSAKDIPIPQKVKEKIITLLKNAPDEFPFRDLCCFSISSNSVFSAEIPFRFSLKYESSDEKEKARAASIAFVNFMQIIFGIQLNLMSPKGEYYCHIDYRQLNTIINTKEDKGTLRNFYQAWQVRHCVRSIIIDWVNKKQDSSYRQLVGSFFEELNVIGDGTIYVKAIKHKQMQLGLGNVLDTNKRKKDFSEITKELDQLREYFTQQFGPQACLLQFEEKPAAQINDLPTVTITLTINSDKFEQILLANQQLLSQRQLNI